jgi:hypothetical protein
MKPELFYLLLTAILTGVLWVPVVIGYAMTRGPLTPLHPWGAVPLTIANSTPRIWRGALSR